MTETATRTSAVRIWVWSGREELRDYFLRLGASAAIDETGAVSVRLEEADDVTVDEYLASWTSANGISATIEPINAVFANPFRERLGEVLVARRLIREEQLQEALAEVAQ